MRIETLERELENLAHTLNDINTIMKCIEKTKENLMPRISMLEERIDKFSVDIVKEKEYIAKRGQNETTVP